MTPPLRTRRRNAGFSLVEVMIGLLIGMIAAVVMMQVFSVSEGYKRVTAGGDDAQNTGAIALHELQYALRDSGFVSGAYNLIGCSVQIRTGITLSAISPVTINPDPALPGGIPAGDTGTDTLLIVYGNSNGSSEGDVVQAQPVVPTTYAVAAAASSASGIGSFAAQDRVIAQPLPRSSPCTLSMEPVTGVAGVNVSVATGVGGMSNGVLYNMGPSPKVLAYAVRNGNLTVCDYMAKDCGDASKATDNSYWAPIASNVVSLRAQYGRDTSVPMDGVVDWYDQTAPTNACEWMRMSALRFALVVRSAQFDKNNAASAPTWAGSASSVMGDALPIDTSSFGSQWQKFRYKTFETTVPLKNIAWQGAQPGC